MSRGQSQPRTQSGRTLGRCKEKDNTDAVLFIDVDSDNFPDVIIIDVLESSQQRFQGSKVSRKDKKFPSSSVISIDDDDSHGNDVESGDLDSDATSRRASQSASTQSQNSDESDGVECQIIQERIFPLKISNSKGTCSKKTFPRNCFTSNSISESSSSESDSSDCELMEGSFGQIRDQWEKAFSIKKTMVDIRNSQSGLEDQASTSGSHPETQKFVEVENEAEQHKQTPDHSSSSSLDDKETPDLGSLSNSHYQDLKNPLLHAQDGDGTSDVQNDIIIEREKIKETDEYKRAIEQEWASRQRELQNQAEEVQRLKKKKKVETMRLLDMERRQKQRVEEMRKTQKKDEETINLKEQFRVEVRKELDRLELMYHDMASLLRGLGIHVGGGLYPMPHEVHAAYKQALFRFHPDRALKTDIRQQVEAEEKFKLISRLKQKYLPTP